MNYSKGQIVFLGALIGLAGLGLGQAAWGISLAIPPFAWPEFSHASFLAYGVVAALAWIFGTGFFGKICFGTSARTSVRIGILAVLPWILGLAWPLAARVKLPAPHDFPLRSLQIFFAALILSGLFLSFLVLCLSLLRNNRAGVLSTRSFVLRLMACAWVFSLVSGWWSSQWLITGDAPHYLLMTQSLLADHDLDLANNYAQKDARRFYDRELGSQVVSQSGKDYPLHRPGLSLLLLPGYALLQETGARWVLGFVSALGGALLYLLLLKLDFSPFLALVGWILLTFSAPWLLHSQAFFGELLAAVLLLILVCAWERVIGELWAWVALGAFFWVNARFYPLALLLIPVTAATLPRRRGIGLVISFALLGAALWLNKIEFGTWNLLEPFRQNSYGAGELLRYSQIVWTFFALFLDQEFGWIYSCPFVFLSILGAVRFFLRLDARALRLLLVFGLVIGPVLLFVNWHGEMVPARYVVPLTPLLVWLAVEELKGQREPFLAFLVPLSIVGGWLFLVFPWLAFSKELGANTLLSVMGHIFGIDLTAIFPSFIIKNSSSVYSSAALTAAVFFFAVRRRKARPPLGAGTGPCSTTAP